MTTSSQPKRILIVRLSALGDIVMASGLIPSLHQRYPEAELYWLTEAACTPLLKHNTKLKEVLIWPRGQWQQMWRDKRYGELWKEVKKFKTMLRAKQFDLVLDAQGLMKSGLCAWMTGAPRRVSIMAREGSHLLVHEKIVPSAPDDDRISKEYRYAAEYLGASPESYRLDLAIGVAPSAKALAFKEEHGSQKPWVALCPFTTRPQKHWFEDRWSTLALKLSANGFQPVILGGPTDKESAARILAQAPGTLSAAGLLKLDESAALISQCQLLIGVDTGLTHMGTALRTPTVALFGSTRPYLRTDSPSTFVMYDALACSPCKRHPTCDGRFDCLRQLTVERVYEQAMHQFKLGQTA